MDFKWVYVRNKTVIFRVFQIIFSNLNIAGTDLQLGLIFQIKFVFTGRRWIE